MADVVGVFFPLSLVGFKGNRFHWTDVRPFLFRAKTKRKQEKAPQRAWEGGEKQKQNTHTHTQTENGSRLNGTWEFTVVPRTRTGTLQSPWTSSWSSAPGSRAPPGPRTSTRSACPAPLESGGLGVGVADGVLSCALFG